MYAKFCELIILFWKFIYVFKYLKNVYFLKISLSFLF